VGVATNVGGLTPAQADKATAQANDEIWAKVKAARKKQVIVIDAGHQAHANTASEPIGPGSGTRKDKVTGGTTGRYTHIPEYKINLEVALRLGKALRTAGYTVYMVRTTNDVNISNAARAKLANRKHASLFIRLHCDSAGSATRGFLTLAPADKGYTKGIYKQSIKAARIIHAAVLKATGARNRGIDKRSDLSGFNWCTRPSVLFEMGNMDNRADDEALARASYQKKLVKGMVTGVERYL
jgi:N-acetylmuramoyl-L-alanine amidase